MSMKTRYEDMSGSLLDMQVGELLARALFPQAAAEGVQLIPAGLGVDYSEEEGYGTAVLAVQGPEWVLEAVFKFYEVLCADYHEAVAAGSPPAEGPPADN
jgi:hypothetical protein